MSKRSIIVTLNSRLVTGADRLETEFADRNAVVLMPPYEGGRLSMASAPQQIR